MITTRGGSKILHRWGRGVDARGDGEGANIYFCQNSFRSYAAGMVTVVFSFTGINKMP